MADGSLKVDEGFNARRCPMCGRWFAATSTHCEKDQSELVDPAPLHGQLVAQRYQIIETIARGGMGTVYLARQSMLDRLVALKIIAPLDSERAAQTQRFMDEARAVSRIRHPNIVTLFDFGHLDDGRLFMALEYVQGQSLAQKLSVGPLPVRTSIEYGVQLAEALLEAHRLGIVHRDIKPDNVMLTDGPVETQLRLLDFGIAHHLGQVTPKGATLGTAEYSAPEAFTGGSIDARADIYAFGVLLYEMLTGTRPYGGSPEMIARRHTGAPIPMIDDGTVAPLPEGLNTYIARMMAKQPDDRPPSIDAVRDALIEARVLLREDRVTPSWGVPKIERPPEEDSLPQDEPEPLKPHPTQNRWRAQGTTSFRWTYIVLLALVAATALGVGALQNIGDVDQGLPTDWRRFNLKSVDTTNTVDIDSFLFVDERLERGANGALVPSMIEFISSEPSTVLPAPYLLFEGRDDSRPKTFPALLKQMKKQQLRLDNEADPTEQIRERLSLISLQWDFANRIAEREPSVGLNYDDAILNLREILKAPARVASRDAVLYYLAHGIRGSKIPGLADAFEKDLIDNYPDSDFTLKAKVHLAHRALSVGDGPRVKAYISELRADSKESGHLYADFLEPFLVYSNGQYSDAVDQALAFIETTMSTPGPRSVFQDGVVELLVLAGARSREGPLVVRGYLRGFGGLSYERRHLPLLGKGLMKAERWSQAIGVFEEILPMAPDPVRQARWSLDYATALAGLDGRHATLSVIEGVLEDCLNPLLPTSRRPECHLLHGRTLVALGHEKRAIRAFVDASLDPRFANEVELRRADITAAPLLDTEISIQVTADAIRAQLERYTQLSEEKPLHWQAVLWGRQAQLCSLFSTRLRTSPAYLDAADRWQTRARDAATRSAAAWSSSGYGLDWYLKMGPIGWTSRRTPTDPASP
jgi:serine/threonine protein kinase